VEEGQKQTLQTLGHTHL